MAVQRIVLLCLLTGYTVFSQNNPLIPDGERFDSVSVRLTYRTNSETFGPVCGQTISVSGAVIDIRLRAALGGGNFPTASVRTQPEVLYLVEDGTDPGAYYTLMLLDQSSNYEAHGTETEPFINWLVVNVQRSNIARALSVVPYRTIIPNDRDNTRVTLLLYLQTDKLLDVSVANFTSGACGDPIRCRFQVRDFVQTHNFTLKYADYFIVEADDYSISAISLIDESHACMMLWSKRQNSNPLLANPDKLPFYLSLRFTTTAVTMGPLCSRAFQYKADEEEVAWKTIEPVDARKIRSLPEVKIVRSHIQHNMTDRMYTLMYVDQSTALNGGSEEMPFVHWMVANIEGADVGSGDRVLAYLPPFLTSDDHRMTFLMFSQSEEIDVKARNFSKNESCPFLHRCAFNVSALMEDHNLELAGGLTFTASADPISISYAVQYKIMSKDDVCAKLSPFNSEGRELGLCEPRFEMWRMLQSQLATCPDEPHRMMIIRRMNSICPELGSGDPSSPTTQPSKGWYGDYRNQQYNSAMLATNSYLAPSDQLILHELVNQYGCIVQTGCSNEIQPMVINLLYSNGYGALAQNCIQADGTLNYQQLLYLLSNQRMIQTVGDNARAEAELREKVEKEIRERMQGELERSMKIQKLQLELQLERELSRQMAQQQQQQNVLATRQIVRQANQLTNCPHQTIQLLPVIGSNNCGVNQILALNSLMQPNMAVNLGTDVVSGMRTNFMCNVCGHQHILQQIVIGQYNQCSNCHN